MASRKGRVHDFPDKELGKAIPYGVYDLTDNEGWVSVGIDHDTAAFAVESVTPVVVPDGASVYPRAKELLITADGGGSNGNRNRLWKVACKIWRMRRVADSWSATSRPGRANGTRSSIGCSATSPRTGAGSPW